MIRKAKLLNISKTKKLQQSRQYLINLQDKINSLITSMTVMNSEEDDDNDDNGDTIEKPSTSNIQPNVSMKKSLVDCFSGEDDLNVDELNRQPKKSLTTIY